MTKQRGLYYFILALCCIVGIVALGGGLFNQSEPWYMQWQHQAFMDLCHQIPERSFWINSQPTAVCSRCLGVYAGFTLGWMLLPLHSKWKWMISLPFKKVALAALLLNLLDPIGHIFGLWENMLLSRLLLGSLMGSSTALIFTEDFFKSLTKSTGNDYGRISATG